MCSHTSPFIQMMACRSNSIWAHLGHSTILICFGALFSSPFYPWFPNQPLRTSHPSSEATCPVFMLAREWNYIVFRPIGLFILKISTASCHSRRSPCIFFPTLFWIRLIIWRWAFSEFRGICCVTTKQKTAVFMRWNWHSSLTWELPWFKERFNWAFWMKSSTSDVA